VGSVGFTRLENDFDPSKILSGECFERNNEFAFYLIFFATTLEAARHTLID
jgi:hypothetical protein